MLPTVNKHKKTILVSIASFLLGMLFLFFGLKAAPSLTAKVLPSPPYEAKAPGKGMAWLQPSPPPAPQAPQMSQDEDEENATREEMDEAEKQMQAMRKQFFGGTDPFEEARKMHEDMAKQMGRGFGAMPGVISMDLDDQNIVEKEDDKAVYYEISGVDQTKLQTRVNAGMLTIEGQTKQEKGKGGFHAMVQSSFHRSFPLPPNVDPNGMEMSSVKDKVILRFPKKNS